MSSDSAPQIFTIAADRPFVDALAGRLLAEAAADPSGLALGRMLVLLPTRRACRALQDAFLRATGGRPLLLPRLQPIGDVEDDDLAFADAPEGFAATQAAEVPPAIGDLRRRLLLARLIRRQGEAQGSGQGGQGRTTAPDQAVRLAGELARLIDQVQTERLDFARLDRLAPEAFAGHWQVTLEFLRIVTENWPAILAGRAVLDPSERRNRMIAARVAAWTADPPAGPVIAAGSTGSIPATADLLALVARLPSGRVVLPGLDRHLDDAAWRAVDQTHPQYGLKHLLDGMGVDRDAVADWPAEDAAAAAPPSPRLALVADALRPAQTTERWAERWAEIGAPLVATAGVTRIDAADSHEEAGVIALIMRRVLEPGPDGERPRTAALVTPDRGLARGVAAALRRWDIVVDDSAGVPLGETPPGVFMRLAAAMLAARLAPVPLLAALKHPLAAGGMDVARFRALVRLLETEVLRGPRPAAGFAGLQAAAAAGDHAATLEPFLARLAECAVEFAERIAGRDVPLPGLAAAHARFAEALAASDDAPGAARLWRGEDGEALAAFVAELAEGGDDLGPVDGARYAALFDELLAGRVVRPRFGAHPRLAILGPLEARLQRFDVMILGGLNEGTWPADPAADPWMSRPMRAQFGLPAPERRIGQSAHDFAQAFCADTVFLTRALRVEGTPTVPSRWLTRLEYLTGGPESDSPFSARSATSVDWLAWQRALDAPSAADRAAAAPVRPAPTPPVEARPTQLSVTQVETWMRDPYAIYARHILRLRALDPIDAAPDAADYGSRIHAVLDAFVRDHPRGALPADAAERLIARGHEKLADLRARPAVWAFWWPRFERVARWFAVVEARRRSDLAEAVAEVAGRLAVEGGGMRFTVTARADRVDRLADGAIAIIDYKTGAPPPKKEVEAGFAPQLPLEAAIARAGGFDGVAPGDVAALQYWRLNGGEPAGIVSSAGDDPARLADEALIGLARLVARFADPATGYESRPRADMAPAYSDYEHLARVLEWSSDSGAGGEDGS
jgi:ATP-dependent helicase/nuclease subunit B